MGPCQAMAANTAQRRTPEPHDQAGESVQTRCRMDNAEIVVRRAAPTSCPQQTEGVHTHIPHGRDFGEGVNSANARLMYSADAMERRDQELCGKSIGVGIRQLSDAFALCTNPIAREKADPRWKHAVYVVEKMSQDIQLLMKEIETASREQQPELVRHLQALENDPVYLHALAYLENGENVGAAQER